MSQFQKEIFTLQIILLNKKYLNHDNGRYTTN
jgi:hypothetical protein